MLIQRLKDLKAGYVLATDTPYPSPYSQHSFSSQKASRDSRVFLQQAFSLGQDNLHLLSACAHLRGHLCVARSTGPGIDGYESESEINSLTAPQLINSRCTAMRIPMSALRDVVGQRGLEGITTWPLTLAPSSSRCKGTRPRCRRNYQAMAHIREAKLHQGKTLLWHCHWHRQLANNDQYVDPQRKVADIIVPRGVQNKVAISTSPVL